MEFFVSIVTDDKDQKQSQKVLGELENIDDDCDRNDIAFVKIDDDKEAAEWGIDDIPTIVRFYIDCKLRILNYICIIVFLANTRRYSLNVAYRTSMKVI